MKPKINFTILLLTWFNKNRRNFPWRTKTNPYHILIAEIMLQRTKADQVAPVYEEFIREFPTIDKLNSASLEQIEKYFRRLGLLWRASLVKKMAEEVVRRFHCNIPEDRGSLLSIPSVGDYVADAILAFAYGQSVPIVDVNVCRVVGRVFGFKLGKEARRKPIVKKTLYDLIPAGKAKEFNWAMIDLASLVCLPKKPRCSECPLRTVCTYARG